MEGFVEKPDLSSQIRLFDRSICDQDWRHCNLDGVCAQFRLKERADKQIELDNESKIDLGKQDGVDHFDDNAYIQLNQLPYERQSLIGSNDIEFRINSDQQQTYLQPYHPILFSFNKARCQIQQSNVLIDYSLIILAFRP